MATVYRARDRRLGREVAVKVIHHHLRENKEVAARFVSGFVAPRTRAPARCVVPQKSADRDRTDPASAEPAGTGSWKEQPQR